MRRLLTLIIPWALLMGACSEPTEKPEVYPELPPTLTLRFLDEPSGKNYFLSENGVSIDSNTHVDSVRVYDEGNSLIHSQRYFTSPLNGSNAVVGWYFPSLDFTVLNGDYALSKTEISRRYLIQFGVSDFDSLTIAYRFTNDESGVLLAEYVKVFYNGEYVSGSQMTNSPVKAWLPR